MKNTAHTEVKNATAASSIEISMPRQVAKNDPKPTEKGPIAAHFIKSRAEKSGRLAFPSFCAVRHMFPMAAKVLNDNSHFELVSNPFPEQADHH